MPTKEIINQIAKKNNTSCKEVEKELFYALTFCDRSIFKQKNFSKTKHIFNNVLEYCVEKVFEKIN